MPFCFHTNILSFVCSKLVGCRLSKCLLLTFYFHLILQVLPRVPQFLLTLFKLLLHHLLVLTSLAYRKVQFLTLSLFTANECLAEGLDSLVSGDVNSSVLVAAVVSVCLSLLIALCMACRRWRKRGKGSLLSQAGGKGKNWNVGDILGRSKEGFRPLSTDERENMLEDDSDSEVGSQYFETFWRIFC